jgi:hypothetical protein
MQCPDQKLGRLRLSGLLPFSTRERCYAGILSLSDGKIEKSAVNGCSTSMSGGLRGQPYLSEVLSRRIPDETFTMKKEEAQMSELEKTDSKFSNGFGSVYNNRVEFIAKKRWWSGGSHEELPLRHVTSVRVETTRSIVGGTCF